MFPAAQIQFSAPEVLPPKEEDEVTGLMEESEDNFNINMTEESIPPPLHEDSPLPKKEPLEMLAKAGTIFLLRNVSLSEYTRTCPIIKGLPVQV